MDYVVAKTSVEKIQGSLRALNGSFKWNLVESSSSIIPDSEKSTIQLDSLRSESKHKITQSSQIWMEGPAGSVRVYPQEVKNVEISIGGAPGSDLDMLVVECPIHVKQPDPFICEVIASSGGPTDVESVEFAPKAGKLYGVGVNGFDVKDGETTFKAVEKLMMDPDQGSITVTGQMPEYNIGYGFLIDTLLSGTVLTHPLFTSGKYHASGELVVRSSDGTVLAVVPMEITK